LARDEKHDSVLEEAMDWLLRLQDAPHDPEIAHQFEIWRSRSPNHDRAWAKARKTWQLMGEVPPLHEHLWKDAPSDSGAYARQTRRNPNATRRHRRSWKSLAAGSAVAAMFAIFLFFAGPALLLRIEADHMTATAESRVVMLEDGSVVTLGAHSAIATHMAGNTRRVVLLSGEAFFEVRPDKTRPFVVGSGGVDVTVLGTTFNVQLSTAATTVELARGSVDVSWKQATQQADTVLSPQEMVAVDRRTGAMVRNTIAQEDIAAWRSGQLFVNDATIGSVVEQLQRYHAAWIKVLDADLAAQRVTGLYDLRDPDRALRALVQPYGGQVREISPYLRVLSRL